MGVEGSPTVVAPHIGKIEIAVIVVIFIHDTILPRCANVVRTAEEVGKFMLDDSDI